MWIFGSQPEKPAGRIEAIDLARATALVAMAVYHFAWDLEYFGYAPIGMSEHGGWRLFARAIASSFLVLVGVSLWLANTPAIRWRAFWRRLAMILAGAIAITIVTWFATPNGFIFFGILDEIALASIIGLLFLRLPALLTLAIAAVVIALPYYYASPFFDTPALLWAGLSTIVPRTNDYVPVFPWFGPVLAGIAGVRIAARTGALARLAALRFGPHAWPLRFAGRHSLAFYLLHQPILFSCVWLAAQIVPAPRPTPETRFTAACNEQCLNSRDSRFCTRYCGCVLAASRKDHRLHSLFATELSRETRIWLQGQIEECSAETERSLAVEPEGKKAQ